MLRGRVEQKREVMCWGGLADSKAMRLYVQDTISWSGGMFSFMCILELIIWDWLSGVVLLARREKVGGGGGGVLGLGGAGLDHEMPPVGVTERSKRGGGGSNMKLTTRLWTSAWIEFTEERIMVDCLRNLRPEGRSGRHASTKMLLSGSKAGGSACICVKSVSIN